MSDNAPGWQADPTGRFEHRYWDGVQWTDNVANAGVASSDAYAPDVDAAPPEAPTEPVAPVDEAPGWGDPTVTQPAATADPTSTWPAASAPPPPPTYVPPLPGGGPVGPASSGSKRGLLIGGGILAVVIIAVIALLASGGDDDDDATEDRDTENVSAEGTYGSDPALDQLYDLCEAGDYQACDDLFDDSPSGSEYEEFADTCGERNEPAGYCVDIYDGDGDEDGGDDDSLVPGELPEDFEEQLAEIYESSMGLPQEKAECLAGKIADAIDSGDLTEEEAMSDIFGYFSDCDIDMSEITGN
jgi:hypothetical protein